MEPGKRKRSSDVSGGAPRLRSGPPAEEEIGDKLVTDNEVEEFFAILHRVRDARFASAAAPPPSSVISGGNGVGASSWSPAFSWEDFSSAPEAVRREATENKQLPSTTPPTPPPPPPHFRRPELIDLNSEPETDRLVRVPPGLIN